MKKKAALLLALVMVLGLLPMNVFGQVTTARPGIVLNPQAAPSTANWPYVFRIDAVPFAGLQRGVVNNAVLDLRLAGGGNPSYAGFAMEGLSTPGAIVFRAGPDFAITDNSMTVQQFLDILNDNVAANAQGLGDGNGHYRRAIYDILEIFGGSIPMIEGWLEFTVPIRANSTEATVTAYLSTGGNGVQERNINLLRDVSLAGQWNNGVTISAVSVVPMTGIARLSGIRVTENRAGTLNYVDWDQTAGFALRLVAERGFRWDTGLMPGLIGGDALDVSLNSASFGNNEATVEVIDALINEATGRHELYLAINLPSRADGFVASVTPAEITVEGISLVPIAGARSTGNVTIDAYVGWNPNRGAYWSAVAWGAGRLNPTPYNFLSAIFAAPSPTRTPNEASDGYEPIPTHVHGARWSESPSGAAYWRTRNLVVANLDYDGDIIVTNPGSPASLVSGQVSASFDASGTDRWLHGGDHTIRLTELVPGTMFRAFDRFELWPVQDGVHIVDARIRIDRDSDGSATGWRYMSDEAQSNDVFLSALTEWHGMAMSFAPRTLHPEPQTRVRTMDIGLMLSVEAGFEANHGGEIDIEVFRNGAYVGTATIANVTDPIVIVQEPATEIERDFFDVLPLTPVVGFTVVETEAGNLVNNDELWFSLQGVQDGREVAINMGQMQLFLGNPVTNEAESGMVVAPIPGPGNGFRIVRASDSVPGEISFNNVYLAGPTVPSIEWHIVVHGPEIAENSEWVTGLGLQTPPTHANLELIPVELRDFANRARFFGMPYSALVLDVGGTSVIEGPGTGQGPSLGGGPGVGIGRIALQAHTLAAVDGVYIPAVIFHAVTPGFVSSMINPRVFADFIGASVEWNDATRTATFSGYSMTGVYNTVALTLDSTTINVNGVNYDIAVRAGQNALANQVAPLNVDGRSFVPARVLADVFGVPIEFAPPGTVILG